MGLGLGLGLGLGSGLGSGLGLRMDLDMDLSAAERKKVAKVKMRKLAESRAKAAKAAKAAEHRKTNGRHHQIEIAPMATDAPPPPSDSDSDSHPDAPPASDSALASSLDLEGLTEDHVDSQLSVLAVRLGKQSLGAAALEVLGSSEVQHDVTVEVIVKFASCGPQRVWAQNYLLERNAVIDSATAHGGSAGGGMGDLLTKEYPGEQLKQLHVAEQEQEEAEEGAEGGECGVVWWCSESNRVMSCTRHLQYLWMGGNVHFFEHLTI